MLRASRSSLRSSVSSYNRAKRPRTSIYYVPYCDDNSISSDSESDNSVENLPSLIDEIREESENNYEFQDERVSHNGPDFFTLIAYISQTLLKSRIPAITTKRIYSAMLNISKHKIKLPEYSHFNAILSKSAKIHAVDMVFNCHGNTLEQDSIQHCCRFNHGRLKCFDIKESLEYIVRSNINYLSTSGPVVQGLSSTFTSSQKYHDIWHDYNHLQNHCIHPLHRLTLLVNLDDASMLASTDHVCTPIAFTIAELPPKIRCAKANVMLAGLWWGEKRISYDLLWENALFKIIKEFFQKPIELMINEQHYHAIIRVGAIILDSVAKVKSLNHSLYNGANGCPHCYAECKTVRDSNGVAHRVYPFDRHTLPCLKTHEFYKRASAEATATGVVQLGVKGDFVLLKYCKIPDDIVVDYMHCVLEGVFKSIITSKPYCNTAVHQRINNLAQSIEFPHEFSRKLRDVKSVAKWRAHEMKTMLLYLIPLYRKTVDTDSFILLLSLSAIVRQMCSAELSPYDWSELKSITFIFLEAYQQIKSESSMKFNFHLLTHLIEQIKYYGNAMEVSAFVFEGNIYHRKKSFFGTRGHLNQMTESYIREKGLDELVRSKSEQLERHFDLSLQSLHDHRRIIEKPLRNFSIHDNVMKKLKKKYNWINLTNVKVYSRVQKDHIKYHSLSYTHRQHSASHYIHYSTNTMKMANFARVEYYVGIPLREDHENIQDIYAVCRLFKLYDRFNLLTGLDKPLNSKIKELASHFHIKKTFFRVKLESHIDIICINSVRGKAFIFPDADETDIYWASEILAFFEHD